MRKKTCGKQKKNRCRRAPVGTPRKKRIMQDAKQPFPHFLGREGANETRPSAGRPLCREREEIVRASRGKLRPEAGDRPAPGREAPAHHPIEGVGAGRNMMRCVLTVVCGAVCRSGRHSERKPARGTQEAIVCGEHPWERGSEPLFFSPPSLDSLLFLESPRIGQVQQRVDGS
mgnify:CR=1 FL=1